MDPDHKSKNRRRGLLEAAALHMGGLKGKPKVQLAQAALVFFARVSAVVLLLSILCSTYLAGRTSSIISQLNDLELSQNLRQYRRLTPGSLTAGALMTAGNPLEEPKELPGCILMMDHRFGWNEDEFEGKYDGPSGAFEQWGRDAEYHRPARFINWMYAMRHGYRFASGNATMYEKDRHPSWFKVAFMRDQLKCCCKWAMVIDSDSYLRMESHNLRIEDWAMRVLTESAGSENMQSRQTFVPGDPLSFFSDKERDDAIEMIIARNGDKDGGWQGDKEALERTKENDVLCAGNFLLRRSKKAIQILDDWFAYNGTTLFEHAWEQTPFNQVVYPKHKNNIAVVPFKEMGPNGRAVNHVWGAANTMEERNAMLQAAAMGVIRSLPTDVLEHIQNRVDGPIAEPILRLVSETEETTTEPTKPPETESEPPVSR